MDKKSGEKILDAEGKEITRPVSFVTGDAEEGEVRVDGKVNVTFTFDGSNLAGRTTVVFETVYRDGKKVAVHADLEDEEQTIHCPGAKTTATDTVTETHTAHLDEKVTIEDVVRFFGRTFRRRSWEFIPGTRACILSCFLRYQDL